MKFELFHWDPNCTVMEIRLHYQAVRKLTRPVMQAPGYTAEISGSPPDQDSRTVRSKPGLINWGKKFQLVLNELLHQGLFAYPWVIPGPFLPALEFNPHPRNCTCQFQQLDRNSIGHFSLIHSRGSFIYQTLWHMPPATPKAPLSRVLNQTLVLIPVTLPQDKSSGIGGSGTCNILW